MRMPSEAQLTPQQREICFARSSGTVVVVGPPGCGKTVVAHFRAARLRDVKPLLLPLFDGIIKSTYWPCDVGHLAHHGAAALGVFATHHLGLRIENLQP